MARQAPSADGCTMSLASAVMPNPTSSQRMGAPRACARESSSRTRTAAPSPCTIPERLREKGRQASREHHPETFPGLEGPEHHSGLRPAGECGVRSIMTDQVKRLSDCMVR